MKTLIDRLNPDIFHRLAMVNAKERDEIIRILDCHIMFVDLRVIDLLYIAQHLGIPADPKTMYRELFSAETNILPPTFI